MVAGGVAAGAPAVIFAPAASGPCSFPSAKAAAAKFCLVAVAGDKQVQLTWTPPAGNDLAIYDGTAPDIRKAVRFGTATGTSAPVTGLTNGTTYYFWLLVGREFIVSNMASATPAAVPGAPAGLTATAGNAQVTLSWAAPASDGGSPVSGYNVYAGTTADFTGGAKVAGVTGTAVVLVGLVNGTSYYFRVNAVNRVGEGPASNEVLAVPVTVPGAPAGLTATAGNAQVTLSWGAPASDGGSPVSGYIIYQGTSPGGETGAPVSGTLVTVTSYTVTGLTNGTTYYFRVIAVNAVGQSPPSGEASAIPVTVPGAPAGLTVTPGNAQVTLSWAAPASDGGSPVTGYDLYAGTTADFNGRAPVAKVTGTVVTVIGLVNGTPYYFRVTAVNRVGEGPAAEVTAVPVTVPGAPAGLTATPGNSEVTLSWAAPASGGTPISGYIIYQGTSPGGETGVPVSGSLVTATSYKVTGLVNGTTYYFRVFAVNAAGQGPPSEEASATLPPIVPSSASPTAPVSRATTPSGTLPASRATTPSGTAPASRATTPSGTAPASRATTPSGTAPASASTSAPAFAAPTGLTATAGDTQVRLSWTAPVSDGGSSDISYKVYIATAPGVQESAAISNTKSTGGTVTGLHNGTVYYFMVTAVNAAGNESPFSTEVSAKPAGPAKGSP